MRKPTVVSNEELYWFTLEAMRELNHKLGGRSPSPKDVRKEVAKELAMCDLTLGPHGGRRRLRV